MCFFIEFGQSDFYSTGKTPWGGIGDHLAWLPWHPGRAGSQLCALAMCCHLLMPDHVMGIRCFPFYCIFISLWNKHTAEHLCTAAIQTAEHLCTAVHFVLFVLLYSTNIHWFTHNPVFTALAVTWQVGYSILKKNLGRKEGRRKDDGRTTEGRTMDRLSPLGACFALPKKLSVESVFLKCSCTDMKSLFVSLYRFLIQSALILLSPVEL